MASLLERTYNPDVLTCLANLSNDEVLTPPELANQVLDLLPDDLWRDPSVKILDPFCKSGVFLREAAKLDGASEARIFFQVVIPMSKPILVYTIINSFMMPWTDFVMAKMILNSGVSSDWTVAIGLYNMLSRTLVNNYFALFCAGGVLVSIPISILFVIMQKFYVEGITSGADKG